MVRVTVILAADTRPLRRPRYPAARQRVSSPGSGGVMKRETYTMVPSAFTETCRGLGPTLSGADRRAVGGVEFQQLPVASSVTKANPPVGAKAMP